MDLLFVQGPIEAGDQENGHPLENLYLNVEKVHPNISVMSL
jgi:hypothetical protein